MVVEGPILKGYYNVTLDTFHLDMSPLSCGRPCFEGLLQRFWFYIHLRNVVEDLVLKGYYNIRTYRKLAFELWKTLF